jgi:hypothetical protein
MKKQHYDNHVRYYTPHHFVFYPLSLLLLGLVIRAMIRDRTNEWLWFTIAIVIIFLVWVAYMMRQHYALTVQNRIIRMEMRFRYYVLTQQRLELLEDRLSFKQLAALRFASDEELPVLVQRALKENLSPNDIKKLIINWQPDFMRV